MTTIEKWMMAVTAALILACPALAATPDAEETWDSGSTEDWTRRDPLNKATRTLYNPSNYLQVIFSSQSSPSPELNIVEADSVASSGAFAGQYWDVAITNVRFKLYCEDYTPGDLRLYFQSAVTGDRWYYLLEAEQTGEWIEYSIPLHHAEGWRIGLNNTPERFKASLQDVEWIGILLKRNRSTGSQIYRIDDFVIEAASKLKDLDGDGANDWHEFMSGTDRGDSLSVFRLAVKTTNTVEATVLALRWPSAPARLYTIYRADDLTGSFELIQSGIPSTPPVNRYIDHGATGTGPYFYKVTVE